MIPIEEAKRMSRRAQWATAAVLLCPGVILCPLLAVGLFFPSLDLILHLVGLGLIFGIIGTALFAGSRNRLTCPACQSHIGLFPYLLRTGRCPRCLAIILVPEAPPNPALVKRAMRNFCIRMAIYWLAGTAGTPVICLWLKSRQLLPPDFAVWPVTWIISVPLGIPLLAMPFSGWAIKVGRRRKAEYVEVAPPYPVLAIAKPNGHGFRLYLAPRVLCFARVEALTCSRIRPDAEPGPEVAEEYALLKIQRQQAIYDRLDPATPAMLGVHKENFQIAAERVVSVTYCPKYERPSSRGFGAVPNGILTIELEGAPPLRFNLLDEISKQEVEAIVNAWRRNVAAARTAPGHAAGESQI